MELCPKQIVKDVLIVTRNLGNMALEFLRPQPTLGLAGLSNEEIDALLSQEDVATDNQP